jgi:hypothetical protein
VGVGVCVCVCVCVCGALFGMRLVSFRTVTITLASSNNALPDDGDCTETSRSCFNVNFNILLKQISCASVGK